MAHILRLLQPMEEKGVGRKKTAARFTRCVDCRIVIALHEVYRCFICDPTTDSTAATNKLESDGGEILCDSCGPKKHIHPPPQQQQQQQQESMATITTTTTTTDTITFAANQREIENIHQGSMVQSITPPTMTTSAPILESEQSGDDDEESREEIKTPPPYHEEKFEKQRIRDESTTAPTIMIHHPQPQQRRRTPTQPIVASYRASPINNMINVNEAPVAAADMAPVKERIRTSFQSICGDFLGKLDREAIEVEKRRIEVENRRHELENKQNQFWNLLRRFEDDVKALGDLSSTSFISTPANFGASPIAHMSHDYLVNNLLPNLETSARTAAAAANIAVARPPSAVYVARSVSPVRPQHTNPSHDLISVPNDRQIFVGGLPSNISADELINQFSSYGRVVGVKLLPRFLHKNACAFVGFDSSRTVKNLLTKPGPLARFPCDSRSRRLYVEEKCSTAMTDLPDECKIRVNNVPCGTRLVEMKEFFEQYGKVLGAKLRTRRQSYQQHGLYGYVAFESNATASRVANLGIVRFGKENRPIYIKRAVRK